MIANDNEKEGTTIFYFKKEICKQCSLKDQCTKQERRTITIGKHHELIMEAKEYNKTQDEEIPWDGKSKILGAAEGECSIHYHCYRC